MGVNEESRRFAEFYDAARDDCLRTVIACVGDWQAAEDLVAEAFARAWARWRTVSRHPAPRAWVVRTALNTRVSWYRRSKHEITLSETADLPVGEIAGPLDSELMAALLKLPERQRQVVALRIFLDLDTAHSADALGIAPGTVTAHLARAMASLRDSLTPRKEARP
jgi:RNA polymerase sigma-70 factor (ECF subfamily)